MNIAELDKNKYECVKLGAGGGSGFVYCGLLRNADFEGINRQIIARNHKTLESAKRRYRGHIHRDVSAPAYVRECEKHGVVATFDGYMKHLGQYFDQVKTTKKTIECYEKKIEEYTNIEDRKVIEQYNSILEPNTIIILFEGEEQGEAWTTKEYEEGAPTEE
jgi:hypothetical protein